MALIWRSVALRAYSTALRPYQQKCVDSVLESLNRRMRPAISLPTGSGKTRIFSYLLQHVKPMYAQDVQRTKVLVVVNRIELIEQSLVSIKHMNPGLVVEALTGKNSYRPCVDVFVGTYQTLSALDRLNSIDSSTFKLIVIDEAHHSTSSSYAKVLSHFEAIGAVQEAPKLPEPEFLEDMDGPMQRPAAVPVRRSPPENRRVHVVGFSATFWRNDRDFLSDVFDEVAYHENVEVMMQNGYLCPAKISDIKIPSEILEKKIDPSTNTIHITDLFNSDDGVQLVYDVWSSRPYKSTVVFACNLEHVQRLCEYFRSKGVDARGIDSRMSRKARMHTVAEFRDGLFPVIVNCQVLTEGTDIPRIDQVILARGISTTGLVMQMIGRGLRLFPGKEHCNIVIFSNFRKFEKHLDFLPQLENASVPLGSAGGGPRDKMLQRKWQPMTAHLDYRSIVVNDKEFSLDTLSDNEYSPESPSTSALRWLRRSKKYYLFLFTPSFSYLSISPDKLGQYVVSHTTRLDKKFLLKRVLLKTKSLSDATKYADAHAALKYKATLKQLSYKADWLAQPATQKQVSNLAPKLGPLRARSLSRGAASSLINLSLLRFELTQALVDEIVESHPKPPPDATPVEVNT